MKKEFDSFTIEYNENDLSYIDNLIDQFLISEHKIMDFFKLNTLDRKVEIKLWNDMKEYETYVKKEMDRIYHIPVDVVDWEIGRAITTKNENQIHLLSYDERIKRKGHSKDTVDMMVTLMKHEFVHTCHAQYKNYTNTLPWFNEALATTLIDQYRHALLTLDCTLEELLNGEVNYVKYYTLGKYIFETYDTEYILQLAKNKELLEEKTPTLFQEAKEWVNQKHK